MDYRKHYTVMIQERRLKVHTRLWRLLYLIQKKEMNQPPKKAFSRTGHWFRLSSYTASSLFMIWPTQRYIVSSNQIELLCRCRILSLHHDYVGIFYLKKDKAMHIYLWYDISWLHVVMRWLYWKQILLDTPKWQCRFMLYTDICRVAFFRMVNYESKWFLSSTVKGISAIQLCSSVFCIESLGSLTIGGWINILPTLIIPKSICFCRSSHYGLSLPESWEA